jgi:hypothetical protein
MVWVDIKQSSFCRSTAGAIERWELSNLSRYRGFEGEVRRRRRAAPGANPEFVEEAVIRGALSQRMLDRMFGVDDG